MHSITENWELKQKVLAIHNIKDRHTVEHLALHLCDVCKEYNIAKKVITTDNAANMVKAASINQWQRFPCFAHSLNLAVTSALHVKEVCEILEMSKKIVAFFNQSPLMYQRLKDTAERLAGEQNDEIGKCRALVQECPTRWNSSYDMLERLVKLRIPIQVVLNHSDLLPTQNQWKLMEQLATVLKPLKLTTELLSGEQYPTMSFVYPTLIGLINTQLKHFESESKMIHKFKRAMKESLENYFQQKTERELMEICSFLDPRYSLYSLFI